MGAGGFGMIRRSSFRAVKTDLGILLLLTLLFAVFSIIWHCESSVRRESLQDVRVRYLEAAGYAQDGDYEQLKKYECAIVDIHSKVVFSNTDRYFCGEAVNLHALSTTNCENGRLVMPLTSEQEQTGTLILFYENPDESGEIEVFLLYAVVLILIVGALCIHIIFLLQKKVTIPVDLMCRQADQILNSKYDASVVAGDRSEVGELCDRLELIRFELRQAEENEKKLKQREENLLASISHDLRTPITTIIGCAEGIKAGIVKTPEALSHYADTMIQKSQLLTHMIESIMESSMIAMSDFQIQQKELYIKPYLEEVLMNLEPELAQKGLVWGKNQICDFLVFIDPDLIYKVVQNIIGNAVKYTDAGGCITVCTKEIKGKNEIMIAITDNGQGIPAEDIPFIFDKFFRGEKARTQNIPGNGLGLGIVKNIITLHGGIVECESILGKGTTIAFSLPLA